jgi:magnesium transporter
MFLGIQGLGNVEGQQRQGSINRQLAAWAAIVAVPTAIAGIYGMNFQNMPELATRYGYHAVLAFMTSIRLAMYCASRRSGWL